MATVIKATDRNRGVQGVAFNFDDMAVKGKQYLEQLRVEAAKLVLRAKDEAQGVRQRAEIEGRRSAQLTLSQELDQKLAQQMQTVLPALRLAVSQIQQARQEWLSQWEHNVVHLAASIAARVIRRELRESPEISMSLVKEALELAAGSPRLRILLHPDDHAALAEQVSKLAAEFARMAPAEVLADAAIEPGGCRVETAFGVIDQQWASQLARIEKELNA